VEMKVRTHDTLDLLVLLGQPQFFVGKFSQHRAEMTIMHFQTPCPAAPGRDSFITRTAKLTKPTKTQCKERTS
jgi:hypothetical protein